MGTLYIGNKKVCSARLGVEINNQDATFTENGVYQVPSGKTGYGEVTVNIPQSTPLDYKGLKTIYRATTNLSTTDATSVLYPCIQNSRVLVNPTRNTDSRSLTEISGYVCDFNFPSVITSFHIELAFKYLGTSGYWDNLTGLGINNYNKRYYVPFLQVSSAGYVNFAFSSDGSTWALNYTENTKKIETNDFINLIFDLELSNNTFLATCDMKKNDETEYTQVLNRTVNVSSICSPASVNNRLSLYYGVSSSGSGKTINVEADMTQTRIAVNGTTYVDGSKKDV